MKPTEIILMKKKIIKNLRDRIDLDKVTRDGHSRRPPRSCGMTIHVGVGCPNLCRYCYVEDMGFPVGETTHIH